MKFAKPRPATASAKSTPRHSTASCEIKLFPSKKQTGEWLSFQEFIGGVQSNHMAYFRFLELRGNLRDEGWKHQL
jgi:hypothetical protein